MSATDRTEADRAETDRAGTDRAGTDRAETDRTETDRTETDRTETNRTETNRAGADRVEADRAEADRPEADRAAHARARADLARWVPPSPAQAALRDTYLACLDARGDALRRTSRPDHLTASGVVLDRAGRHTLLVLHRKLGLWVQPGGHCEPGDRTLRDSAAREVAEETGLRGPGVRVSDAPVLLSRHGAPCGAEHHDDVQFLVTVEPGRQTVTSDESYDVAWFPVDELPALLAAGVPESVAAALTAISAASRP